MPGLDGLEATRRIVAGHDRQPAAGPPPRIMILTTFDLDEYVYAALQAGAERVPAEGRDARTPRRRRQDRGRSVTRCSRHRSHGDSSSASPPGRRAPGAPGALATLTARETEVFGLVARGMSNAEIADGPRRHRGDREDARRRDPVEARGSQPGTGSRRSPTNPVSCEPVNPSSPEEGQGVSSSSCSTTSSNGSRLRSARLTTTAPSLAATTVTARRAAACAVQSAGDVELRQSTPPGRGRSRPRDRAGPESRSRPSPPARRSPPAGSIARAPGARGPGSTG